MKQWQIGLCVVAALTATLSPALANDWSTQDAKVTVIESTYMPDHLLFTIDQAVGNCPAGAWLSWSIRGADSQARIANVTSVLSVLLTAFATGRRISVAGDNVGCMVKFIHINSND